MQSNNWLIKCVCVIWASVCPNVNMNSNILDIPDYLFWGHAMSKNILQTFKVKSFEFRSSWFSWYLLLLWNFWSDSLYLVMLVSSALFIKRSCEDYFWKTLLIIWLKACIFYFYQIFIFSPNVGPSKTMKNVFSFI